MEIRKKFNEIGNKLTNLAVKGALVVNQLGEDPTVKVAAMTTNELLSRRDFLKIASAGIAAVAGVVADLPTKTEAQSIPTSIVATDPEVVNKFVDSVSKLGIPKNSVSAFSVNLGGFSKWDFFSVAPLESTNNKGETTVSDERLFVKDVVFNNRGGLQLASTRYVELHKNTGEVAADKTTVITTWTMAVREPRIDKDQNDTKFEKVLWYPELSEDQWKIVAQDKTLSQFFGFMGFLPPSTTVGACSNWGLERKTVDFYNPKTGKIEKKDVFAYPIDLANELPDDTKRTLIRRERVKAEPALPAEVMEKFDKAGINSSDLENATFDQNGLHITLPDGTTTDISLDEFKANTFNAVSTSAIRIIDTANKDGVFVMNQNAEGKWVVEKQVFTPANGCEIEENVSAYNFKFSSKTNLEANYWDIIVSHRGDMLSTSEEMKFNRKIYGEVIKDHPEWEGIGDSWDPKEKQAFAKEFLERSGGLAVITDMNWNKFEGNFNEEIKFKVTEVDKIPNGYSIAFKYDYGQAGMSMYINENGQVIYSFITSRDAIKLFLANAQLRKGWTAGMLVSDFFRIFVANTSMHSGGDLESVNSTNHKLYVESTDPEDSSYFRKVTWTFIESDK